MAADAFVACAEYGYSGDVVQTRQRPVYGLTTGFLELVLWSFSVGVFYGLGGKTKIGFAVCVEITHSYDAVETVAGCRERIHELLHL